MRCERRTSCEPREKPTVIQDCRRLEIVVPIFVGTFGLVCNKVKLNEIQGMDLNFAYHLVVESCRNGARIHVNSRDL